MLKFSRRVKVDCMWELIFKCAFAGRTYLYNILKWICTCLVYSEQCGNTKWIFYCWHQVQIYNHHVVRSICGCSTTGIESRVSRGIRLKMNETYISFLQFGLFGTSASSHAYLDDLFYGIDIWHWRFDWPGIRGNSSCTCSSLMIRYMATSRCSKPQEWGNQSRPQKHCSQGYVFDRGPHVAGSLASSGKSTITIQIHEHSGMAVYVMRPNSNAGKPTSRVNPLLLSPSKPIKWYYNGSTFTQ